MPEDATPISTRPFMAVVITGVVTSVIVRGLFAALGF
jgi:hypothetical protein